MQNDTLRHLRESEGPGLITKMDSRFRGNDGEETGMTEKRRERQREGKNDTPASPSRKRGSRILNFWIFNCHFKFGFTFQLPCSHSKFLF